MLGEDGGVGLHTATQWEEKLLRVIILFSDTQQTYTDCFPWTDHDLQKSWPTLYGAIHSLTQQIFTEHQHGPRSLSTSIQVSFRTLEFFQIHFKTWSVTLFPSTKHPNDHPFTKHLLFWRFLQNFLFWAGLIPIQALVIAQIHLLPALHPLWTSVQFPAPLGSSADCYNLSSLLFQNFFCSVLKVLVRRNLKL